MAITLRDIAKRLNLSHATVSFVLNYRRDVAIPESTRQRVLAMAKEMGYRPNRAARALVMGRTNILGVWCPRVKHPHYADVLDALSEAGRARGFETLYSRADILARDVRPFEWPIDAVIAVDVHSLLQRGFGADLTVISVGAWVDTRFDHVQVDMYGGACSVVQNLVDTGAQRIMLVKKNSGIDQRDRAYEVTLEEAGLTPEIVIGEPNDPKRLESKLLAAIRTHGLPDAIFAHDDVTGIFVYNTLRMLGYNPPEHYRLAGFDGINVADFHLPEFTTVRQPVVQLATEAVSMAVTRISDPRHPLQSLKLPMELIVRDSTRAIQPLRREA